ncbi:hypothetical protein J2W23_005564 [Variovorax boronicumulans]|uniref:sce7726 family protein n=1 Tax=Variovorax boronicumulans TaxID=436515 RepID=UPI002780B50D|nr:sce7726 family protein [Variovorax boronicumulans]MDQ0017155.1 hypothetical protein [Variovorax boronicumulans]
MQVDIQTARLCARAFTRPTIAALANGKPPAEIFSFLKNAKGIASKFTVGEFFAEAFKIIESHYRNEYFFKAAITNRIVFGRHSPRTCSLSVELPVGNSIVDLAIFNGTSTAYEIKTKLDSPRRLITQTPDYLRVFDRVFLVTAPELSTYYADVCDKRVGILALNHSGSLRMIREASSNTESLDARSMFRVLRRSEYQPALEKYLHRPIDRPNGLIASHCEKLFESIPKSDAHAIYLAAMRARFTKQSFVDFISTLPSHLRVLGYATPLNSAQQSKLMISLSKGFQLDN